jgi:hypothetical protein
MKTWILLATSIAVLSVMPYQEADAHDRHGGSRSYVSVGVGVGYYWPYRYYYPRSYVGVEVYPRRSARTVTTRERSEVRSRELFVYPAAGQSESRMADDRYDCHVWAASQSGFDPTLGAGSADQADSYARAMTACLEARNYVVR